ncbi:uncharacterized protein LOC117653043 [Thrips palmi]|uniref:Uncharacterized protein LOC117653043 n=1 Tax=Thrips palmi TaxID=161013 RepID=A0A6P9A9R7_THRPL|nr:uncharacterized protein LOC117653043 [Thrips palmi]
MDIIEREEPSLDGKLAKPMFWGKVAGFTAQELRPEMFDECLKLIEKYLIPEEAMCVALDMKSDAVSKATLLASARDCMKDGTSIVVLKGEDYVEEEDEDDGGEEQPASGVPTAGDSGDTHDDAVDEGAGEANGVGGEAGSVETQDESGDAVDAVDATAVAEDKDADEREGSERSEQKDEQDVQAEEDDDGTVLSSEEERWRKERRKRRHKRRKKRRQAEERKQLEEQQGDQVVEEEAEAEARDEEDDGEDERRVVAVMVARVVQRTQHMRSFSRIKVVQGDAYQQWLALRCHLQKTANLFERYNLDTYYRVYHIVVHPDYRKKGVGSFLVKLASLRLAELFAGLGTVCTAVAPSRASQRLLARQGFKPHAVLHYHEWKDDQGRAIITGAGTGNYSAVLAVFEVAPRDPDVPLDVSPLVDRVEEVPEGPRPVTAFPGREQGLSRPPKPECPPAHEEPPFGIATARPRPPRALSEWQADDGQDDRALDRAPGSHSQF